MWEDQGWQDHGWFGHGTSGNDAETFSKADIAEVAYAAVPDLAAGDRARFEGWLGRGGMEALQEAMPVWAEGSDLPPDVFRTEFFGPHGDAGIAGQAQRVGVVLDGAEPGRAGSTERYAAGRDLADMVQAVTVHGMPALMTVAARTARSRPGRSAMGATGRRSHGSTPKPHKPLEVALQTAPSALNTPENVQQLAALLETEAGGKQFGVAMVPVAFTVVNRMVRNKMTTVDSVWGQYKHYKEPTEASLAVAQAVLNGTRKNPVGRATHFYTPQKGVPPPIATRFPEIHVPSVPPSYYRFFAAPGNGPVSQRLVHIGCLGMFKHAMGSHRAALCVLSELRSDLPSKIRFGDYGGHLRTALAPELSKREMPRRP